MSQPNRPISLYDFKTNQPKRRGHGRSEEERQPRQPRERRIANERSRRWLMPVMVIVGLLLIVGIGLVALNPFSHHNHLPASTTTILASSSNPSALGQDVIFTAIVGGANPTGIVTFSDGTVQLGSAVLGKSGRATFSISSLSVGHHDIFVVYGGSSSDASSRSALLMQTVKRTKVPKPHISAFIAHPSSLPAAGGIVNLDVMQTGARTCHFISHVSGSSLKTISCANGTGHLTVTVRANLSTTSRSDRFELIAHGPGGTATAFVTVSQSGHTPSSTTLPSTTLPSTTLPSTTLPSTTLPAPPSLAAEWVWSVTPGNEVIVTATLSRQDGTVPISGVNLIFTSSNCTPATRTETTGPNGAASAMFTCLRSPTPSFGVTGDGLLTQANLASSGN